MGQRNEHVGANVKRERDARAWSQQCLADKAGLSKRTVQRIESGEENRGDTLQAVAQVFEVTVEFLRAPATTAVPTDLPPGHVPLLRIDSRAELEWHLGKAEELELHLDKSIPFELLPLAKECTDTFKSRGGLSGHFVPTKEFELAFEILQDKGLALAGLRVRVGSPKGVDRFILVVAPPVALRRSVPRQEGFETALDAVRPAAAVFPL